MRSRGSEKCCSESSPTKATAAASLYERMMGDPEPDRLEPHLLVVDDDARLAELLRRYLADNGFRVTTAADASMNAAISTIVAGCAVGCAGLVSAGRRVSCDW